MQTTSKQVKSLKETLGYDNDAVVGRFLKLYRMPHSESEELFTETKRFLWAVASSGHPITPPPIIDEMWHNFLLFTRNYRSFCHQFFGRMIHHTPLTSESRYRVIVEAKNNGFDGLLERQLATLYDLLGEETVLNWYVHFPERFDEEFFSKNTLLVKPPKPVFDFDPLFFERHFYESQV